jgi:probable F420-dependent oxidoreductase
MKFAYYFPGRWYPPSASLLTGAAHRELARAAEASGFDAVSLDEHPAPSDRWREGPGGHDALDPFVGLAGIAAATEQIKLLTYLAVLPYRNPFLLAKAAATLDVMSDGRLILGVGTGYLKSEFAALGIDFDERNALFDESMDILAQAWTGEPVTHEGRHFSARGTVMQPRPIQVPGPPIWIGGNSALTRRRVVERAQGWLPMPQMRVPGSVHRTPPLENLDDLRVLIEDVRSKADAIGRTEMIEIGHSNRDAPPDPKHFVEWTEEAESIGVTWLMINGQGETLPEALDFITGFGTDVIGVHAPADSDTPQL